MFYSAATFCENTDIENWKCGGACTKVPGVVKVTRVRNSILGVFGYVGYNTIDN